MGNPAVMYNRSRNTVPTKGAEYKFLDILETSKKLFFSSSEGGNLVVRLRRISLLKNVHVPFNFYFLIVYFFTHLFNFYPTLAGFPA